MNSMNNSKLPIEDLWESGLSKSGLDKVDNFLSNNQTVSEQTICVKCGTDLHHYSSCSICPRCGTKNCGE